MQLILTVQPQLRLCRWSQIQEEHLTARNVVLEKMCDGRDAQGVVDSGQVGRQMSEAGVQLGSEDVSSASQPERNSAQDGTPYRSNEGAPASNSEV